MTTPAWAAGVCEGVHAAGSRDVVYVPDNRLSHVLGELEARFRDIRLVLATREEEAFGIAAGLYLGGRRPTVMLQSSGLGNPADGCMPAAAPHHRCAGSIMTRLEATRAVVDLAEGSPIVASLGHPAYDLAAAGDRPQNFYTWGSMGLASSIGVGLALARPDLRVFIVDGDGSLLMNLGSLATIGQLQLRNLVLVVMDNEEYATTGGQKTPTADGADLAAAGQAMGVARTATVGTAADLERAIRDVAGPLVVIAKVAESAPVTKPPLDCVFIKQRFMAAIDNPEPATIGQPLPQPQS